MAEILKLCRRRRVLVFRIWVDGGGGTRWDREWRLYRPRFRWWRSERLENLDIVGEMESIFRRRYWCGEITKLNGTHEEKVPFYFDLVMVLWENGCIKINLIFDLVGEWRNEQMKSMGNERWKPVSVKKKMDVEATMGMNNSFNSLTYY